METTKYIAKWEGGKNGNPVLFLPEYEARIGNIVCYAHMGQHGEASASYYRSLRNPKGEAQIAAVADLAREYASLGDPTEMVRVMRDSDTLRNERYKWMRRRNGNGGF